jgi:hypothetical protein
MHHRDAAVRYKANNLVGNLCRHSALLYPALAKVQGLLPALAAACSDPDPIVRKFAAFAVGNAAFHDGSLYGALRCAIPLLVTLIVREGEDDKIKSNAAGEHTEVPRCLAIAVVACCPPSFASPLSISPYVSISCERSPPHDQQTGALGNLCRNNGSLCPDLIDSGALDALLGLLATTTAATGNGTGGSKGLLQAGPASVKITLFALGNMCVHGAYCG